MVTELCSTHGVQIVSHLGEQPPSLTIVCSNADILWLIELVGLLHSPCSTDDPSATGGPSSE